MAPDPDILAEVMRLKWKKGLTLKEAWSKLKSCNLIQEKESFVFSFGRGMSIGNYSFLPEQN
jgi:hypothetical protein